MKLKKLTASILAAALALTAIPLTVSAEAEETEKLPLVTAELSEIHGAAALDYVGRGVYFYSVDGEIKGAVRISDEELKKWRKTGKLKFTDLDTEDIFTDSTLKYGWYYDCTFADGDYMTLSAKDSAGNEVSRIAVRYDEAANSIVKVKELEKLYRESYNYCMITHNGTTLSVASDTQNRKVTVKAIAADGTELFTNTHDFSCFGDYINDEKDRQLYNICINVLSDETLYYIMQLTEESDSGISGETALYAVDYKGEMKEIARIGNVYGYAFAVNIPFIGKDSLFLNCEYPVPGYNYFSCCIDGEVFTYHYMDNKIVTPPSKENGTNSLWGIVDLNGYTLAAKLLDRKYECDANPQTFEYALIDVKNNVVLSKTYKDLSRSYDDGKTYLVQQDDGKWGYISSDGKELAFFDDAGIFYEDYAPVISEGKAYIINRDMEIVSDGIEAEEVWFLNKNVECIKQSEKYLLINVFSEKEEEEPPVTEPETTAPDTEPETTKPEEAPAPETTPAESYKTNTFTDSSGDKAADVQVTANESVIPSNAVVTVKHDKDSSTDTRYAYDLTFTVDGKEYQPNGTVTVKIPVPEELKDSADKLKVYHFTNGNYINMNAKIENGYLVFTTDHFSIYVVTTENLDPDKASPTGAAMGIVPVVVLAALAVAAKKRK